MRLTLRNDVERRIPRLKGGEFNSSPDEQINEQITDRQRTLLDEIEANPFLTYAQAAERAGVSNATIRRDFAALVKAGLVERAGSRKSGSWKVLRP